VLILLVVFVLLFLCSWGLAGLFLYRRSTETILLSDIPISVSLGVLLAGFVYVLFLKLGVGIDRAILLSSILVAALGVFRWCRGFSFSTQSLSSWDWVWNSLMFICLSGLTIGASLQIGVGDYPPIFINDDSSLRLAHAFSLFDSTSYPPEGLFVAGRTHAYHYGAPASVAAIASFVGLPLHKAMFWIFCPLLMLGIFSLIYQVTKHLLGSSWRQRFSMTLFLPYVMLGSMSFSFVNNTSSGIIDTLSDLAKTGMFWSGRYDGSSFGNGVWDVSMLSGMFLLLLAAQTATRSAGIEKSLLALCIAGLTVFCKLDVAPAVFLVLGVAIVLDIEKKNLWQIMGVAGGLILIPALLYFFFGYGEGRSEVATISVRSWDEGTSFFDWRWNRARPYLIEIGWVVIASIVCLAGQLKSGGWRNSRTRLVSSVGIAVLGSYLITAIIFVPKTGVQFSLAMWIGVPILGSTLLVNRTRLFQWVGGLMLFPIVFFAGVGQLTRLAHAYVVVVSPSQAEEYSDNRYIGEAMKKIPIRERGEKLIYSQYVDKYVDLARSFAQEDSDLSKEEWGKRHYRIWGKSEGRVLDGVPESIVVTNDFRYSKWDDTQPQIAAMFGHKTYSTHPRLFPGRYGFNELAAHRVNLQKERLSRRFSNETPEFVRLTLEVAKKEGWTHYLMRKDLDDGLPPINSASVPLKLIFENERYAVYEFIRTNERS